MKLHMLLTVVPLIAIPVHLWSALFEFDTDFDAKLPTNGVVYCLVGQPEGKVLVVGSFPNEGASWTYGVRRLFENGDPDSEFRISPGAVGRVYVAVLDSEQRILVGGEFRSYHGVTRSRICRLLPNGEVDLEFDAGEVDYDLYPSVNAIAVQADGKIVIGGRFYSIGGVSRTNLARLNQDGSVDKSFDGAISGLDPQVEAVHVSGLGTYVIGDFEEIAGGVQPRIARLLPNGSLDLMYRPQVNGYVNGAVVFQTDGSLLITGNFTSVNSVATTSLARLKPGGATDVEFQFKKVLTYRGQSAGGFALAQGVGGEIFIGGVFDDGTLVARAGYWGADPEVISSFTEGQIPPRVYAIAPMANGDILVGGEFNKAGSVRSHHLSRFKRTVPPMTLRIRRVNNDQVRLSWADRFSDVAVNWDEKLHTGMWKTNDDPSTVEGNERYLEIPIASSASFFKLEQP